MRGTALTIKQRIGVDLNRRIGLEPGLDWAIRNDVRYLNICLDPDPELFDPKNPRLAEAGRRLRDNGITLGLHTLSAVNVAENSRYLSEAMDEYLIAYLRSARAIGAGWVIMHGGYHFTADKQERMEVAVARLDRMCRIAEDEGVIILLENMNPEPADAEVKYLVHDVEEAKFYFANLTSPILRWAFTSNHAHMLDYGIQGFLDQMQAAGIGTDRIGEVRLADNRGVIEEHLYPGTGNLDFVGLFTTMEARGYRGHYMQDYTTIEDMLSGRDVVVQMIEPALERA
jgi:sugar phosphate isomerase/epimerase